MDEDKTVGGEASIGTYASIKHFWKLNTWLFKYFYSLKKHYAWMFLGLNLLSDAKSFASIIFFSYFINIAMEMGSKGSASIADTFPILGLYGLYNLAIASVDFSFTTLKLRASNYFSSVLKNHFFSKITANDAIVAKVNLQKTLESVPVAVENYFLSLRAISGFISAIVVGVILLAFSPWFVPVLIVLAIPQFIADSRFRKALNRLTKEKAPEYKAGQGMTVGLMDSGKRAVLKEEGLAPFVASLFQNIEASYLGQQMLVKTKWTGIIKLASAASDAATIAGFAMALSQLMSRGASVGNVYFQIRLIELFKGKIRDTLGIIDTIFDKTEQIALIADFFSETRSAKLSEGLLPDGVTSLPVSVTNYTFPEGDILPKQLTDISFEVPAGTKFAIVSSGNTSRSILFRGLTKRLIGFSGTVKVGGLETTQINRINYFNNVYVAPSPNYFYHLSIKQNVALGLPESPLDEQRVRMAIEKVGIVNNIEKLPKKLDQVFDKRIDPSSPTLTPYLSTKLMLARAVYRAPKLVIVNIPPSLDSDPRMAFDLANTAFKALSESTVIVFGIWPSIGRNADSMIVISQGKIIKAGNYTTLYPQAVKPPEGAHPLSLADASLLTKEHPKFKDVILVAKDWYGKPASGLIDNNRKVISDGKAWIHIETPDGVGVFEGEKWRISLFGPPVKFNMEGTIFETLIVRVQAPAKYKEALVVSPEGRSTEENRLRDEFNTITASSEFTSLITQMTYQLNEVITETKGKMFIPGFSLEPLTDYGFDLHIVFVSLVKALVAPSVPFQNLNSQNVGGSVDLKRDDRQTSS